MDKAQQPFVLRAAKRAASWSKSYLGAVLAIIAVPGFMVLAFLHAAPPPDYGPTVPGMAFPPGIPSTGSIWFLVIFGCIWVGYFLISAFLEQGWFIKALLLIAVLVWLVFGFAWIYYQYGNAVACCSTSGNDTYPAFDQPLPLSKTEAVYFAVGILTTAGTGSISPQIDPVRTTVTAQMSLDLFVIVIGVAGVVRGAKRPRLSEQA